MKTIVIYFSYTGNTEKIAKKIASTLHADYEELQMEKPYSSNYQTVVEQGQIEVRKGYKPTLKPLKHDIKYYDRIIIGSPTFWYKMTPAVLTFLSGHNFTGKSVVLFMTHAGWPGTVIKDMTTEAEKNGANVKRTIEIKFDTQADGTTTGMATSEEKLDNWINLLKQE